MTKTRDAAATAAELTKPQLEELERLSRAPQPCYGKARARVQNNLYVAGCARFLDPSGNVVGLCDNFGIPELHYRCEITDFGREVLTHCRVPVGRWSTGDPARVEAVAARIRASKSGYVKVQRFGLRDRGAMKILIDRGDAEIIDSPVGRAYRLIERAPTTTAGDRHGGGAR